MSVTQRKYDVINDFNLVSEFLVKNYQPSNRDGNFLQPAWEYMHSHPDLDEDSLGRIGVWEDSGQIVGIAHYELYLGEAFFEIHPGYTHLKQEMLEHAENNLYRETQDGQRFLHAYVNDYDKDFEAIVKSRGYQTDSDRARPMTQLPITPTSTPVSSLPEGFQLKSLAEDNDFAKISRVFWRGFNHGDEPPEDDIEGCKKMQSAPNFRKNLNIVVVAPDGNYVTYTGTWFDVINRFSYVEPVCTDPDYRRLGFARTSLFESLRRCGELGAEVAYVGSTLPLYQTMGFKKLFTCNCWSKNLNN